MNKQELFESIMKSVSKEVKNTINESVNSDKAHSLIGKLKAIGVSLDEIINNENRNHWLNDQFIESRIHQFELDKLSDNDIYVFHNATKQQTINTIKCSNYYGDNKNIAILVGKDAVYAAYLGANICVFKSGEEPRYVYQSSDEYEKIIEQLVDDGVDVYSVYLKNIESNKSEERMTAHSDEHWREDDKARTRERRLQQIKNNKELEHLDIDQEIDYLANCLKASFKSTNGQADYFDFSGILYAIEMLYDIYTNNQTQRIQQYIRVKQNLASLNHE